MAYQRNIATGLSRSYASAPSIDVDSNNLKLIVFSDHHKGKRDAADDFAPCEPVYLQALDHYQENGFTLAVLGDVEDLWENRPEEILPQYREVSQRERVFNSAGRYFRFFGNHDDEWSYPDSVRKYLQKDYGNLHVYEGMRLRIQDANGLPKEIFLVHGHQGTLESDRLSWISRWIVRNIWRPFQRLANVRLTTAATNWRLRHRHEVAMYNWAIKQSGMLLITGHTHHPIFPSHAWLTQLLDRYQELRRRPEGLNDEQLEELEAEIAYARQQTRPCYFNTGCCSFADGSISGIEISEGQIRLVRWLQDSGQVRREILDRADLYEILDRVQTPAEPISESIPPLPESL
ncbi:MAG: hypothetical protein PVF85_13425 [Anaerolineales bacterium]|jgi:UDP-2,3-diacylglucosamine pyrophosphatase LpxH